MEFSAQLINAIVFGTLQVAIGLTSLWQQRRILQLNSMCYPTQFHLPIHPIPLLRSHHSKK